jgi:hypothetical protein
MRTELRLLKCNASNTKIWGNLDNDPNRKKTSANKLDKKCYTVSLCRTALSHRNACTARPSCDSCHTQGHHKRDTPALVLDGFTNKLSQCISMMKQPLPLGKRHCINKTNISWQVEIIRLVYVGQSVNEVQIMQQGNTLTTAKLLIICHWAVHDILLILKVSRLSLWVLTRWHSHRFWCHGAFCMTLTLQRNMLATSSG